MVVVVVVLVVVLVVVVVVVIVVVVVVVNMKCSVTLWSVYGRGERDEKKVTKKYPSRDCKSVSGYIDSKAKKKHRLMNTFQKSYSLIRKQRERS